MELLLLLLNFGFVLFFACFRWCAAVCAYFLCMIFLSWKLKQPLALMWFRHWKLCPLCIRLKWCGISPNITDGSVVKFWSPPLSPPATAWPAPPSGHQSLHEWSWGYSTTHMTKLFKQKHWCFICTILVIYALKRRNKKLQYWPLCKTSW